jgi:cytochrome P450 family 144
MPAESPPTPVDRLFHPGVVEDPYEYLARLRESDPVHEVRGTGTFLVTRMDLIHEVIADPARYSSETVKFLHLDGNGIPELRSASGEMIEGPDVPMVLATADPPDHTRQRKVLARLFTKSAVEAREREVRAMVDTLLDPLLDVGEMDWIRNVAMPLPALVLSRLLGLPDHAADFVRDFGYASGEQISGFATEDRCREIQAMIGDLGPVAQAYGQARGTAEPDQNTVVGVCARAVQAGELNDLEAFVILLLLVSAGSESTTSLIGTGAALLAQDRALQERLRHDAALIDTFVEEACRIDPPFRGHYRRVTEATELGGVHLPAETRLVLVWPSANHDETAFEDPETIDVDRAAPRRHVGFGWGIHLCLGAPLARLEARVAFEQLLARTARFELSIPAEGLRHHHSLLVRRLVDLPLRLIV